MMYSGNDDRPKTSKSIKVLHLPTSVGGNAAGLAQAERQMGLSSETLYMCKNWLDYHGDYVVSPLDFAPLNVLLGAFKAVRICNKYDIFHFNFGATLVDWSTVGINHWDLPLYKNSPIFVTYNGCDARQKHLRIKQSAISACKQDMCYNGLCNTQRIDFRKSRRINQFEKAGAHFFALNPDLMNFLPPHTTFLPYSIADWDSISCIPCRKFEYPLKLIHAPTNRIAKGSESVMAAIEMLQERYPKKIEFTLVENVTHSEALNIYKSADVVIDQLRIGWYGALAVEAMCMGKPVIAYINQDDLHYIPKEMASECMDALIVANEFTLLCVLEELLLNPEQIATQSVNATCYCQRWHNPAYVASLTKAAYLSALRMDT